MKGWGIGHALVALAGVAIVGAVIAALMAMGSPAAQREARLDERRIDDLRRIARGIDQHVRQHEALPPDLATLAGQPGTRLSLADPATARPYRYSPEAGLRYRLCAVFATDSAQAAERWTDSEWAHGRGEHCFARKAEKPR
ncbi:hypothetical protein [Pseudoxanthomonas mexicana]|uniref:hypothetical protein n=1 Tax=Pseudoxanthomonas mexicana TaxID=128785 RepID=UPI00398AF89A